MTFTYWQDGDMYLGYLNAYPDYPTQGHTLDELKVMLADILADVENDPEMRKTRREQGVLDGSKTKAAIREADGIMRDIVSGKRKPKTLDAMLDEIAEI